MDVLHDDSLKLLDAAPATAADAPCGNLRKPSLHKVKLGSMCRGEVHYEPARLLLQELAHFLCVVSRGVVHDEVQHLLLGDPAINQAEELDVSIEFPQARARFRGNAYYRKSEIPPYYKTGRLGCGTRNLEAPPRLQSDRLQGGKLLLHDSVFSCNNAGV